MVKRSQTANGRKQPLLPLSVEGGSRGSSKAGTCAKFINLAMPLLACSMILSALYLLIHNMEISIDEMTVSSALADYEPTWEILLLLCTGAFASFIVTISRSIQIGVYHRRNNSSFKGLRFLNFVAAMCNILAYVGFIILAIFPVDGENKQLHIIGAFMYFCLIGIYAVLHIFLLWKQKHYSKLCKIVLTILPAASVFCSVMFGLAREEGYQYEWFAIAFAAIFAGCFVILFRTDPCDDELLEFFCCKKRGPAITEF